MAGFRGDGPHGRGLIRFASLLLSAALAGGATLLGHADHSPSAASTVKLAASTINVVAVGDIASASGLDDQVAALTARLHPTKLLLLGDIAYPKGSSADFRKYFDPDWARFSKRWVPIPGNHEYLTAGVAGYRGRFNRPSGPLYSTTQVGAWRVIGLDSQRANSATQLKWLRKQLAQYPGQPVLVMWHRPRYSSGVHGDQRNTEQFWRAVSADRDVKLVLWGHDHDYERMAVPVKGKSPITAMVVGTGGGELRPTPQLPARSWRQFYVDHVTGVLQLKLAAHSFTWNFVEVSGKTLDSGAQQF